MGMRRGLLIGGAAAGVLALTGCVGGGPTAESLAGELATPIETVWTADVPGLFGEPALVDGVVLAYAIDDEVGMRLTALDLETGDTLWEHTASPGGAFSNPILSGLGAASRAYPLPTITPFVIEHGDGEDAVRAVVFTERDTETPSISPDDFLHVVEVRSGDELEVTVPDIDPEDFRLLSIGVRDDGRVFANFRTPPRACDAGVCWSSSDSETFGEALVTLDPDTLELRVADGYLPEADEPVTADYGVEYVNITADDGFALARYVDGAEVWRAPVADIFGVERTRLPEYSGVTEVGDLLLVQGYQSIRETLDEVHTFDLDFATSRTLAALDPDTGDVLWTLAGGDMLCSAVAQYEIPDDATSIPICRATGGSFLYDIVAEEMVEQTGPEASIASVDLATGELGWEVEGAGAVSLANVTGLLPATYAARGAFTVADRDETTGVIDLRDGTWAESTGDEPVYPCKAERDDVKPEFEGSAFAGGSNPITTGYPAGWRYFPCDVEGSETDAWSAGAARIAGYRDPSAPQYAVLPGDDAIVAVRF
jgi:outer membrane protein assembly factor BamB